MNVKEASERLGIQPKRLFENAYKRYGMLFSIGGPRETYERWKTHGVVPIYVARYCRDVEKYAPKKEEDQPDLFI